jgi:hypothetical protein
MDRDKMREEMESWFMENVDCEDDHFFPRDKARYFTKNLLSLLAPVIEKAEKYKKALEQIERGCSFPEDDVQRAIRDVARKTLFEVPDGN